MVAGRTSYLYLTLCLSTVVSFIFLALTTFSAPMSTHLYFLRSSEARGVRFGAWGWCLEEGKLCMTPMKLGYTWEPQISVPITGALVLYPIASILTFLLLVSLAPMFRTRSTETTRVIRFFALSSFFVSALAFIFMISMFDTARKRFRHAGFGSQYGPLPWLSLIATVLLAVVATFSFKLQPIPTQNVQIEKSGRLTSPPHRRRIRPLGSIHLVEVDIDNISK